MSDFLKQLLDTLRSATDTVSVLDSSEYMDLLAQLEKTDPSNFTIEQEKLLYNVIVDKLSNASINKCTYFMSIVRICFERNLLKKSGWTVDLAVKVIDCIANINIQVVENQRLWLKTILTITAFDNEVIEVVATQRRTEFYSVLALGFTSKIFDETIKVKLLKIIQKLFENDKDHNAQNALFFYDNIIPLMFNYTNKLVQEAATSIGTQFVVKLEPAFKKTCPSWRKFLKDIVDSYLPACLWLVSNEDPSFGDLWIFILKALGTEVQLPYLTNHLLSVVEKAFKGQTNVIRKQAFRCWQELIVVICQSANDNLFAKRIKLMVVPLKTNNCRTEELVKIKFKTWCKLIDSLNEKIGAFDATVIEPFLYFCFGPLGDTPLLAHIQPCPLFAAPGKKYPMLHLDFCLTFLKLIGNPELDKDLFGSINHIKYERQVTLEIFERIYKSLIFSAGESSVMLCELRHQNAATINGYIWMSLFEYMDKKPKEEMLRHFSNIVLSMLEQNKNSSEVIIFSLKSVLKIFTSEKYSFGSSRVIADSLFIPLILAISNNEVVIPSDIHEIFQNIFTFKKNHADFFGFVSQVLDNMKESINDNSTATFIKNLSIIWCCLANSMRDQLKNDPDSQDSNLETVNVARKFLLWPLSYLHRCANEGIFNKWSDIYESCMKMLNIAEANKFAKTIVDDIVAVSIKNALGILSIVKLMIIIVKHFDISKVSEEDCNVICEILEGYIQVFSIPCIITGVWDEFKMCVMCLLDVCSNTEFLPKLLPYLTRCLKCILKEEKPDLLEHVKNFIEENIKAKPDMEKLFEEMKELLTKYSGDKCTVFVVTVDKIDNKNTKTESNKISPIKIRGSFIGRNSSHLKPVSPVNKITISRKINEESQEYVLIDSPYKFDPKKLTKHQKEKFKERSDDIPALYQDTTQSQSMDFLNSDSQSKDVVVTPPQDENTEEPMEICEKTDDNPKENKEEEEEEEDGDSSDGSPKNKQKKTDLKTSPSSNYGLRCKMSRLKQQLEVNMVDPPSVIQTEKATRRRSKAHMRFNDFIFDDNTTHTSQSSKPRRVRKKSVDKKTEDTEKLNSVQSVKEQNKENDVKSKETRNSTRETSVSPTKNKTKEKQTIHAKITEPSTVTAKPKIEILQIDMIASAKEPTNECSDSSIATINNCSTPLHLFEAAKSVSETKVTDGSQNTNVSKIDRPSNLFKIIPLAKSTQEEDTQVIELSSSESVTNISLNNNSNVCRKVLFEDSDKYSENMANGCNTPDITSSPLRNDTPTRNKELFKNTLDLSPIRKEIFETKETAIEFINIDEITQNIVKENEDNADTLQPISLVSNFMIRKKKGSFMGSRGAQMMGLVSAAAPENSPVIKKEIPSTSRAKSKDESETIEAKLSTRSRIQKIMVNLDHSENNFDLTKDEDMPDEGDMFSFTKILPSPSASPRFSILKKRKYSEIQEENSVESPCTKKQKRVNFADPPVSCKKFIEPNSRTRLKYSKVRPGDDHLEIDELNPEDELETQLELFNPVLIYEQTASKQDQSDEENDYQKLDSNEPICPRLISSTEPLCNIIPLLAYPNTVEHLKTLLSTINVETIGDLAQLTELQIYRIPLKVDKVKIVLDTYKLEDMTDTPKRSYKSRSAARKDGKTVKRRSKTKTVPDETEIKEALKKVKRRRGRKLHESKKASPTTVIVKNTNQIQGDSPDIIPETQSSTNKNISVLVNNASKEITRLSSPTVIINEAKDIILVEDEDKELAERPDVISDSNASTILPDEVSSPIKVGTDNAEVASPGSSMQSPNLALRLSRSPRFSPLFDSENKDLEDLLNHSISVQGNIRDVLWEVMNVVNEKKYDPKLISLILYGSMEKTMNVIASSGVLRVHHLSVTQKWDDILADIVAQIGIQKLMKYISRMKNIPHSIMMDLLLKYNSKDISTEFICERLDLKEIVKFVYRTYDLKSILKDFDFRIVCETVFGLATDESCGDSKYRDILHEYFMTIQKTPDDVFHSMKNLTSVQVSDVVVRKLQDDDIDDFLNHLHESYGIRYVKVINKVDKGEEDVLNWLSKKLKTQSESLPIEVIKLAASHLTRLQWLDLFYSEMRTKF